MTLQKKALVDFIRARGLGVVSTVSAKGAPEAALVNLVVTDAAELIFYTLQDSRKGANLRHNPKIAVVIGWDNEKTLQYEGVADEPAGFELEQLKQVYAAARPNAASQMRWPGLTYFRVRPQWARLSDYSTRWSVEELVF